MDKSKKTNKLNVSDFAELFMDVDLDCSGEFSNEEFIDESILEDVSGPMIRTETESNSLDMPGLSFTTGKGVDAKKLGSDVESIEADSSSDEASICVNPNIPSTS